MAFINGNDGADDILVSTNGSDIINGKSGFDVVDYRLATGSIFIPGGIIAHLGTPKEVNGEIVITGPGSAFGLPLGLSQHDTLYSIEGLFGTSAKDVLEGDDRDNVLFGRSDNDTLRGFGSKDYLAGELGDDILDGGFGNDKLEGGKGNDTLTGGAGADRFTFSSPNEGTDTITDFRIVDDTIEINSSIFKGGLTPGAISADQFHLGSGAVDSSDRFIYSRTGDLFFDADGSGTAFEQVKIATLTDAPLITAADIIAF